MEAVYAQYRKAGIVVPFISNDAHPAGYNAPGQPAPVDIYGHDGYPLGFNCTFPGVWKDDQLPTDWRKIHLKQSPKTPYSLIEVRFVVLSKSLMLTLNSSKEDRLIHGVALGTRNARST
jgi:hypothetical protein